MSVTTYGAHLDAAQGVHLCARPISDQLLLSVVVLFSCNIFVVLPDPAKRIDTTNLNVDSHCLGIPTFAVVCVKTREARVRAYVLG